MFGQAPDGDGSGGGAARLALAAAGVGRAWSDALLDGWAAKKRHVMQRR